MPTDFHLRVQRVLEGAMRARPESRDGYIRRTCAADTRLLREVRSLLPHFVQVSNFEPRRPGGADWKLPGTTTFLRVRTEAGAVEAPETEPKPPFSIDQYTAVQILGRGGMGIVYRAIQPTLHRVVAIKVLRRRLLSPRDCWRFTFEEEILRQLRHPGIARFSHSGIARLVPRKSAQAGFDERPYFVMEYVPGESLTRFAATHQLDVRQRLALFVKVCDAVEYAHYRSIVHCDLKPDNILVTAAGEPKVLDFGIAHLATVEALGRPEQGTVAGTLPYASPEQLLGRVEQITPASDVYALGLIAHELLTGKRPLREGWVLHPQLQSVCIDTDLPPDHPRNCELRYYMQGILATALRQTRGESYRSAGPLGADIDSLLAQFAIGSRWSALKKFITNRPASPAGQAADPLGRPLSAVLRKRIGMALETDAHQRKAKNAAGPPKSDSRAAS